MKIDLKRYWKDIKQQDRIIAKLEKSARKKDRKEFEKWDKIVKGERKLKKADWL